MSGHILDLCQPDIKVNQWLIRAVEIVKLHLNVSVVGVMMIIYIIVVVLCFVTNAVWLFCSERPQSRTKPQVDFVYIAR